MRRLLLGLACAAAIAVGCGSSVVDPGQTGTGGGATAGIGGATTTTPEGGGAGGDVAFTSGTGGAGGDVSFTTGAGGGPLCTDGPVFVDIAGDVMQHIDASCAPQGALVFGSAGPGVHKTPPDPGPSGVAIMACSQGPGVVLSLFGHGHMWPGTSMVVDVSYQYNGEDYQNTPLLAGLLEVDTVGPIDGAIEGSFSATVAPQGGTPQLAIHGTFRVCRTYDEHLA